MPIIVISLAILFSSKGPVIHWSKRIGKDNIIFMMPKFRTMTTNTPDVATHLLQNPSAYYTPVGKFLRNYSLDELPQFLNVLFGDMSIVGPRPERTQFVNEFKHDIDGYMQKHMVKAGITGWAQVNGWRGDTDLSKRIECDLYYINNWSVGMDIKIIFLTFYKGFISENAK